MNALPAIRLRVLGVFAAALLAFGLVGCGLSTGRPIEKGEGDGHAWAPEGDGKFVVFDVDNQCASEVEFVAHGRIGLFRMIVEPGKHQYMVLKDSALTAELRTKKEDAGKAEFLQMEERLLGVRRVHMRVNQKGAKPAPKTSASDGSTTSVAKPDAKPAALTPAKSPSR